MEEYTVKNCKTIHILWYEVIKKTIKPALIILIKSINHSLRIKKKGEEILAITFVFNPDRTVFKISKGYNNRST